MLAVLVRLDEQRQRGGQQQNDGHRMVDQLVDGFRDDATGAEREETRYEQTERADQEAGGHQQEEQHLRMRVVVAGEVPGDHAHADGAEDLLVERDRVEKQDI